MYAYFEGLILWVILWVSCENLEVENLDGCILYYLLKVIIFPLIWKRWRFIKSCVYHQVSVSFYHYVSGERHWFLCLVSPELHYQHVYIDFTLIWSMICLLNLKFICFCYSAPNNSWISVLEHCEAVAFHAVFHTFSFNTLWILLFRCCCIIAQKTLSS